jgi:predicted dehydrogenase
MPFTAGIHALDRLLAYAGRRATHVSAVVTNAFHDQQADDSALLLLRFDDEAAGQVASIGYREGTMISADELVCESGVLSVDFFKGVTLGRDLHWESVDGSFEEDVAGRALARQWRAFAAAVVDGKRPPVTGDDGLHVVACIEAAFAAQRDRREVAIER